MSIKIRHKEAKRLITLGYFNRAINRTLKSKFGKGISFSTLTTLRGNVNKPKNIYLTTPKNPNYKGVIFVNPNFSIDERESIIRCYSLHGRPILKSKFKNFMRSI